MDNKREGNHRTVQTSQNKQYAGQTQLWQAEEYLQNYNKDLILKFTKVATSDQAVLEFGAGIGTISNLWAKETGIYPDCYEIDPEMVVTLKSRGFDCYENFEEIKKSYDVIFTSNVLEHIENDLEVLEKLFSLTNQGGHLIIYVPAFQLLYSNLDATLGHYRRYQKRELLQKVRSAGYVISQCNYSDSVGFFAWLSTKMSGSAEENANIKKMRFYDKVIFPISRRFDAIGFRFILGKNLLVFCKKVDSTK